MAVPGTAPRKRMPRAERERQMLTEAQAVFTERGYAATSMDEIAERVGVSKPMLYEYFNSKEGLLLACIRRERAELYRLTEAAVENAQTTKESLRSGLLAYFEYIRERRAAWALLRQEVTLIGTPAADELEHTKRQQNTLLVRQFSRHLGTDPSPELEAAAEIVIGGCERLAIWCERNPSVTPEQATELAMTVLWSGLAAVAH